MTGRMPVLRAVGVLALTVLAALLRLYHLGTLPAGLHHDEASNGMLALQILQGNYPVFFSAYTGKEAGYMYLVALCIRMLGQTILAIRLPAALAGIALVPITFLVGRRVLNERGAWLAAGATACAPWLVHINRIGFRASLLPLLLTLWAWLLLRALDTNRWRDWLGAGLFLGIAAYTYTASRFVPVLIVLFVLYLLLWHGALVRTCWRGFVAMLAVATLLATRLFMHYLRHPEDWSERLEQIGVCAHWFSGECFGQIGTHAVATLGMVGIRGDPIGFFNLPGAPALPIAVGWLFYVGLIMALRRWREPAMALVLLWWIVLVLPGVLSRDSPHFLRTLGAAPPTMLLWALPLAGWKPKALLARRGEMSNSSLKAAAYAALIVLMATLSAYDYFGQWANRPELYYDYMGYATEAAYATNTMPSDVDILISEEYYRHPTYLYLAPRTHDAHWFDGRFSWPMPATQQQRIYILSPATPTDTRVDAFLQGAQGQNSVNAHGQYAYTVLDMPKEAQHVVEPQQPLEATIGMLNLRGITTAKHAPDGSLYVTLFWSVTQRTERDVRVFLHLVDAQGHKLSQHDVMGYPAREWQPGDDFATFHTLTLPTQPANTYQLKLGVYDIPTGERMQPLLSDTLDREGFALVMADGSLLVPLPSLLE